MNLRHHGDSDTAPGLIDLAVNVRSPAPAWLLHALTHDPARWASYPDPRDAMAALANRHRVPPHYVLPVAGAAAAFTLVAESLRPTQPVVVHPPGGRMSKPKSIKAPTDEQIEEDIELLHRLQAMSPEKRAQLQSSIDALTVAYEEMLVAQAAEREIEEAFETARKRREEALKALREGRIVSVRSRSPEDSPDDDAGLEAIAPPRDKPTLH